jgi:hypothetical protein
VLLEEQCFAMTTSRGDDIWRDCADNPIMARKVKMPLSEPHGSSKPSNARPFDAHHGLANELPVVTTEWTRRDIEDTDEEAVACGIPASSSTSVVKLRDLQLHMPLHTFTSF